MPWPAASHERLGALERQVTVGTKESTDVVFTFTR